MSNVFENSMIKIINKISSLEKKISSMMASRSLYLVLNENTPDQVTADQNNYIVGDYDVIRMSTDASRTITGIAGGKKGRVLTIHNVGSQNIVIAHQSASSSVENRVISPTAANITLGTNDSITLYYDSTDLRWRVRALVQ